MFAQYCRVMITPETPKDDDGFVVEDYKIKFYEVSSIASKYTITVNKNQGNNIEGNLFKIDSKMHGKYYYGLSEHTTLTPVESVQNWSSAMIDCSNYTQIMVGSVRSNSSNEFNFGYVYFGDDKTNNKLSTVRYESAATNDISDIVFYTIEVPKDATRCYINYTSLSQNGVFVYGVRG